MSVVDAVKPETVIGGWFMWRHTGVLYKCVSHDEDSGTYHFESLVNEEDKMTCLYSFLGVKMALIKNKAEVEATPD